jgi:hypothetical protein
MTIPKTDCPIVNKGFTTKETYLAWRAAWKALYAGLTVDIQQLKRDRKEGGPETRSSAQWQLALRYRPKARGLLELRKQSKEEAQRQYLAAKAPTQAAA